MKDPVQNTATNETPETIIVSVTELKRNFGALSKQMRENISRLLIEHYGQIKAIMESADNVELDQIRSKKISVTEFRSGPGKWLKGGRNLVLTKRKKIFATVTPFQQNLFPAKPTFN